MDSGLYIPSSNGAPIFRHYVAIRGHLIAAASQALMKSIIHSQTISNRNRDKVEADELMLLNSLLRKFIKRETESRAHAKALFGSDDWMNSFPRTEASVLAAKLSTKLNDLTMPYAVATIAKSPPNQDVLSQSFIREMRFVWGYLTRRTAPKTGGKLLISLAAGIWQDAGFKRRNNERPLEDWLAERFKNLPV